MAIFTAAAAIGSSILGAIGVTAAFATGVTFATVAVGFVAQAAIGLALNALTPKPKIGSFAGSTARQGYAVNQRGSALDHQIIYGEMRTGGAIVFDGTTGTNNKFLHRVIAFTGHEIESFNQIYINDEVATLDGNGNVTNPSRYNGFVRIKKKLGTDGQVADADLVDEVTEWTTDHRLRGVSYLYVRFEFDQDVFPNGVPEVTAVIRGKKVFDPRTGITAFSDNPALCLRDYILSGYGLDEELANIDDSLVIAAANVCDETNTVAGTKRYTCNGAFTTAITPYDLLQDMLTSMGGLLWYAQGQWRMKPAYYVAPTLSFNEDDLRSSIAVQTRHSRRDNFNTVRGTFRGPESDYQITDYPEVTNSAFITADGGQESVADIELPFTDSSITARRIARIALERNRQQLTVSASFGLRAFQAQVGDIIQLSVERFGWSNKEFEVASWTFGLTDNQDLQVQMTLREISANVFDEVDDGVVYERDNTNLPSPFITVAPQNLVVSDGGFTTDDGTFVNSFIVDWDAPDDAFVDFYVLEWRVQGDSKFKSVQLESTEFQISPVTENVTYDIRVKAVNVLGVSGPYATTTAQVGGDSVAPSLPTSITATGGFKYITIDWTNPPEADLNYIEVWENTSNTTVGATLVGEVWGTQFVRTGLDISETRFYFLRAVDFSGNTSGYTSGVSATTTFVDDADFENGIRSLFEEQGLYPIEDVDTLPASGILNRKVFNRADGKLYEWNGSAWVLVVAAVEAPDIDGQLTDAQIADLAAAKLTGQITETQISDDSISTPKLQAGSISTAKIAANAITANEIAAGSITSNEIATNTITANDIATGTITASEISGNTITGDKIVANTITGGLLATSGIITNSAQINNAVVTNAKIANAAITTVKIDDAAITNAKIDDAAITTAKIDDLAVVTAKIQDLSVDTLKINGNAVTSGGSTSSNTFTFTGIAGSPVLIFVLFDVIAINSTGAVTIRLNGTPLQTFRGEAEADNVFGFTTGQAVTGTNTVSISEVNTSLNTQTVVQLKR